MRVLAVCISLVAGLAAPTLLWAAEPPPDPAGATTPVQATSAYPAAITTATATATTAAPAPAATTPSIAPEAAPAQAGATTTTAAAQLSGGSPALKARPAAAGLVSIAGFAFSPRSLSVSAGDTVTWSNNDSTGHTATGGSFDTGTISPGSSASHTFTQAGTFAYACSIHPNMHGTITVTASAASTVSGSSGSASSSGSSDSSGSIGSIGNSGTSASSGSSGSSLPVTGLDALMLGAMGAALLAGGLLLRRRVSPG